MTLELGWAGVFVPNLEAGSLSQEQSLDWERAAGAETSPGGRSAAFVLPSVPQGSSSSYQTFSHPLPTPELSVCLAQTAMWVIEQGSQLHAYSMPRSL